MPIVNDLVPHDFAGILILDLPAQLTLCDERGKVTPGKRGLDSFSSTYTRLMNPGSQQQTATGSGKLPGDATPLNAGPRPRATGGPRGLAPARPGDVALPRTAGPRAGRACRGCPSLASRAAAAAAGVTLPLKSPKRPRGRRFAWYRRRGFDFPSRGPHDRAAGSAGPSVHGGWTTTAISRGIGKGPASSIVPLSQAAVLFFPTIRAT
jgi:hypothetical protein